jgi:hypothetical protein
MYRGVLIPILFSLFPASVFAQTRQQQPPPPPTPPPGEVRPRLSDSATGYIDNAIVGSRFRVRFDAGYGINAPDRAEFFYGKCGCYRFATGTPNYDPNAPGPGVKDQSETNINFQEFWLDPELRVNRRASVFAEVPVVSIDPTLVPKAAGIGDVRLGFKGSAVARENLFLTGQFRTYAPSGNAREGLGTNHWSIEPGLLYYQSFSSERIALAGQFEFWHPINGSAGLPTSSSQHFAGNVVTYGFGGSYEVIDKPRFRAIPVVELVGWRVLGGFQTLGAKSADGVNIVNIKIGARLETGGPGSFYVGYGHALTNAVWYENIVRTEYRIGF